MQQRQVTKQEDCVFVLDDIEKQQHPAVPTPKRRILDDPPGSLPLFTTHHHRPIQHAHRVRSGCLRSPEKWVHCIPIIVLLSFFILWFFSHPVNVVIKDGRITEVNHTEKPSNVKNVDPHIDLAILTVVADPPVSAIPYASNGTHANLSSGFEGTPD